MMPKSFTWALPFLPIPIQLPSNDDSTTCVRRNAVLTWHISKCQLRQQEKMDDDIAMEQSLKHAGVARFNVPTMPKCLQHSPTKSWSSIMATTKGDLLHKKAAGFLHNDVSCMSVVVSDSHWRKWIKHIMKKERGVTHLEGRVKVGHGFAGSNSLWCFLWAQ